MLTVARDYFRTVCDIIEKVMETQHEPIDNVAEWITESIREGGVLHVFGSGHGHVVGEDLFYRAGGLAPVNAILDFNFTQMGGGIPTRSTMFERLEGYTTILLKNYDLRAGEVIVIASQSGINAAVIEAALVGKARGLKVVALTSLEQSSHASSRHSSGKRLFEIADTTIDNCIPPGDAVIKIAEGIPKAAPVSTVIHCSIMQAIVAEVAKRLYEQGIEPPLWISANVPGGDERIAELMAQYGGARLRTH
jgi:uncharacterized phosphosugar-binding protein